jgi:hypothetical protein
VPDAAWKRWEREVAELIGGTRWLSEKGSNAPDVKHELLSPECKYRSDTTDPFFKAALHDAIEQAKANALPRKPWAVFVKRRRQSGGYVVMDAEDFGRLIRELQSHHEDHGYMDPDYKPEPYVWGENPLMDVIMRDTIDRMREQLNKPLFWQLQTGESD